MKTLILLSIALIILVLHSCSKNAIQSPLESDVLSINYRYFNVSQSTQLNIYSDSIRLKYKNAMIYPLDEHDTLLNCNRTIISSILSAFPLTEFWQMEDVIENPRLQDGTKITLLISGYERSDNNSLMNRNTITKTVQFPLSSTPESLKISLQKIDSLIQSLKHN